MNLLVGQVAPNLQINDYFNLESPTDMEREKNLYFPVVTGMHYRTKTPPDQQPTKLSQGYDETRRYLQCV